MKYSRWIFDMDGTLTDSMGIWDEVPFALLRSFGRQPKPGLRQALAPLSTEETARYMIDEYALPLAADTYDHAVMNTVRELYKTVSLKPGVQPMLDGLRARGARLCVCSATWQPMCEFVLERLGVLDRFEFVLSAQAGYTKREPAIFYEAMQRLGGSSPADCVVCEDALYAARTAHAAGFGLIGIADPSSREDEGALRALSGQFLTSWEQLDWSKL